MSKHGPILTIFCSNVT